MKCRRMIREGKEIAQQVSGSNEKQKEKFTNGERLRKMGSFLCKRHPESPLKGGGEGVL